MSAPQQLFTVDADGNGAGRIVSETGDVYEGSFQNWNRHGWGVQRWANGSVFRGSWHLDSQAIGIFVDGTNGSRWKGDFRTGQVERLEDITPEMAEGEELQQEEAQQQQHQQEYDPDRRQQQQDEEKEDNTNVTHFPASSSNYQAQPYDPLSQTQPATSRDFSSTAFSRTQTQLPPNTARSARSGTATRLGTATSSRGHRIPPRPQLVKFQRRRESKQERLEREEREAKEEAIVLKELKASMHLMSRRFGSSRIPNEATFGIIPDSPGPGAYHNVLSHLRAAPKHTMAPLLPKQSEVALIVKTTASSGPWSSNVKANNPSKPAIPAISINHPSMLPAYVKESTFFHPITPGPGFVDTVVGPKGTPQDLAHNSSPVADHGGHTIKGHPIPRYLGKAHMRTVNLGRGADGGMYNPKIDFQAGRESAPKFTMRPRYRDQVYHTLRLADGPSPAAYTPSFSQVHVSPTARVSGFGRSRAGARPHPTDSVRAVAYMGEKHMRNQLGLASPGPAAYDVPRAFNPPGLHPKLPGITFVPHVIQPPAVDVAERFRAEQHPFVQKFKQQQAKEREVLGGVQHAELEDGGEEDADQPTTDDA
jgi:hypothetical protein